MRVSGVSYVRARSLLSSLFNKTKSSSETDGVKLSKQQQEKLRTILPGLRTDSPKSKPQGEVTSYEADDILDYQIDIDSIRARGFLKYRYNYEPASDVKDTVLKIAREVLSVKDESTSDITQVLLNDNFVKAKIILKLSEKLMHCPTNARLMHIKSVQDLVEFYEEPVENITSYTKLARQESKPANVFMLEHARRFHPEDIDAWHGGITAFPGSGGKVISLRNKRLLRQFQPKSDWFDYEDQTFDYNRPDKDMPWDSEIARRMDRYPEKRFDLKTKQFIRSK
ncbi:hypothetical protein ANCCEY_09057 [Ancylostoma ceylanicum]|uniref:Large ribosomal subunit protein mL50 n=2 Tax=Ancylostoma ceylanicum TaxID=53326 RepID=A0A0D6LIK4_9BILA|nr:hypothetical protein ANCCEY_09057 [Ancylostoma ceylanicum]EYB81209.1 hypothetical protein Y032_0389g514 [Ancylostoma ceylanicum]